MVFNKTLKTPEIDRVFDFHFWINRKERKSIHHSISENPFANVPVNRVLKEELEETKEIFLAAWDSISNKEQKEAQRITEIVIGLNNTIKKL